MKTYSQIRPVCLLVLMLNGCGSNTFAGSGNRGPEPQPTPLSFPQVPATIPTLTTVQEPVSPNSSVTALPPGVLPSVDPLCSQGAGGLFDAYFPDKGPMLPQSAPQDCRAGFELNNLTGTEFTLANKAPSGTFLLEVDVATYLQPDKIRISAVGANGTRELLLDTCRLRTYLFFDPTDGASRPPEETIRSFRIPLGQSVTSLVFDLSGTTSPYYLSVTGLCQFDLVAPATAKGRQWRPRP